MKDTREPTAEKPRSDLAGHCAGIWIDHRIAYIVRPNKTGCQVDTVESGLTQRHRSTGGKAKSRPYLHENGASSASRFDDAWGNSLKQFFLQVSERLGKLEELYLLGPGSAKIGFREHLAAEHKTFRVEMETAEHITEPQLKAKVMSHFGRPAKRHWADAPGQPPH